MQVLVMPKRKYMILRIVKEVENATTVPARPVKIADHTTSILGLNLSATQPPIK